MCNRIHFQNAKQAQGVASLLKMRGYHVGTISNGCSFEKGLILEVGDSAFEFALQVCDAFEFLAVIEG